MTDVTFGDGLTAIDGEQVMQPAKEWISLLGFLPRESC